MTERRYPIQGGPSVPWEFMAPHEAQARKNHGQTLERLAERGGLGCDEAWVIVHGLSWDALHAEEHKRKWIELAERVNREWSTKQAQAEVLAALNCQNCGNKAKTLIVRYKSDVKPCCPVYVHLDEFQPAAKDLEELLRKAELKGINIEHATAHVHEPYDVNGMVLCWKCVRKLELEKSREAGFVCTHCNNAGPLSECPKSRNIGFVCPRCSYCVQVLPKKERP